VILRRYHAADHDDDVTAAELLELALKLGHRGQMGGGERGHPDDMHVVLDRLTRRLGGGCKQGADIDIKAEIGKGGGDGLLAANPMSATAVALTFWPGS